MILIRPDTTFRDHACRRRVEKKEVARIERPAFARWASYGAIQVAPKRGARRRKRHPGLRNGEIENGEWRAAFTPFAIRHSLLALLPKLGRTKNAPRERFRLRIRPRVVKRSGGGGPCDPPSLAPRATAWFEPRRSAQRVGGSMVEGAPSAEFASRQSPLPPRKCAVPLPRFAGQDEPGLTLPRLCKGLSTKGWNSAAGKAGCHPWPGSDRPSSAAGFNRCIFPAPTRR